MVFFPNPITKLKFSPLYVNTISIHMNLKLSPSNVNIVLIHMNLEAFSFILNIVSSLNTHECLTKSLSTLCMTIVSTHMNALEVDMSLGLFMVSHVVGFP
ncbi:hypothetical protein O6H91_03G032700 [Diphasiastrum complanatum]|uniref:Uncharacterized protein n=1 Tax=Diphasiastrum complanatum TaxID=34168 RepID=A0ACC2E5D3_DIPCM|nr:hypothetical protein O6H91_03G032700 [Diphasiastrum complanatum]